MTLMGGDPKAALADYQAAQKLSPDNPMVHLQLAQAYRENGQYKESIQSAKKFIEAAEKEVGKEAFQKTPLHGLISYYLGMSQLADGQIKDAAQTLENGLGNLAGIQQKIATDQLVWIYSEGPDRQLYDKGRAAELKITEIRQTGPQLVITAGELSSLQYGTLRENYENALSTISVNINDLAPYINRQDITRVYSVADLQKVYDVLREQQGLPAGELLDSTIGLTAIGEDTTTGKYFATIYLDEKVLLNEATSLMVLTHELRHVETDLESMRKDKTFEKDPVKREIPVYKQTMKDLKTILDSWKKDGRDKGSITALEKRVADQRLVLERLQNKKP